MLIEIRRGENSARCRKVVGKQSNLALSEYISYSSAGLLLKGNFNHAELSVGFLFFLLKANKLSLGTKQAQLYLAYDVPYHVNPCCAQGGLDGSGD